MINGTLMVLSVSLLQINSRYFLPSLITVCPSVCLQRLPSSVSNDIMSLFKSTQGTSGAIRTTLVLQTLGIGVTLYLQRPSTSQWDAGDALEKVTSVQEREREREREREQAREMRDVRKYNTRRENK